MAVQSSPNNGDIRLAIYRAIRGGASTVGETVTAVSEECDCPETVVIEQVRNLEDAELLYRDGSGSDAEVRLP